MQRSSLKWCDARQKVKFFVQVGQDVKRVKIADEQEANTSACGRFLKWLFGKTTADTNWAREQKKIKNCRTVSRSPLAVFHHLETNETWIVWFADFAANSRVNYSNVMKAATADIEDATQFETSKILEFLSTEKRQSQTQKAVAAATLLALGIGAGALANQTRTRPKQELPTVSNPAKEPTRAPVQSGENQTKILQLMGQKSLRDFEFDWHLNPDSKVHFQAKKWNDGAWTFYSDVLTFVFHDGTPTLAPRAVLKTLKTSKTLSGTQSLALFDALMQNLGCWFAVLIDISNVEMCGQVPQKVFGASFLGMSSVLRTGQTWYQRRGWDILPIDQTKNTMDVEVEDFKIARESFDNVKLLSEKFRHEQIQRTHTFLQQEKARFNFDLNTSVTQFQVSADAPKRYEDVKRLEQKSWREAFAAISADPTLCELGLALLNELYREVFVDDPFSDNAIVFPWAMIKYYHHR